MGWAVARSRVGVLVVRVVLCKIRTVLRRELVDRGNQFVDTKWFGNILVLFHYNGNYMKQNKNTK